MYGECHFFALLTVAANKRLIQFMKGKKSDNSMLAFPVLMSIDSGFYDNEINKSIKRNFYV